jgi:hypothetical protein
MADVIAAAAPTAVSAPRPRGVRGFHVALVLVMSGIVLAGFWTYYSGLVVGGPHAHWVIHLHGAVFTGWMLLLLTQALLVDARRIATHRRLGKVGLYYGVLVVVLGLTVTFVAPVVSVQAGRTSLDEAAAFLIVPLGDMLLFAGFFGAGMAYRQQRDLHKRLMVLATTALLFAPVGRLAADLGVLPMLGLWLLPLGLAMGHDLLTRRRVERVYLVGLAVLLVAFARVGLMQTEAWRAIGRAILMALMPASGVSG